MSLKARIQLLTAQVHHLDLTMTLQAEDWDWKQGDPPWMKRGKDGTFGGGGSGSGKENSGDKPKNETTNAPTNDAVTAELTAKADSMQTMQTAVQKADLGTAPGTEELKTGIQDTAIEVAQAVTQTAADAPFSLLSKDVIHDPEAFLKGVKEHAKDRSAMLAVDAARLAMAGIVGVVQAVANDPTVKEASAAFGEAVNQQVKDTTAYVNQNVTNVEFAKQQTKNMGVALSKAGKSLSEQLSRFMTMQITPYKDTRGQPKQTTQAAAGLKIDLPPLKAHDDADAWADQLPALLQSLKGVSVAALTERLGDADIQQAIAKEFERLIAST